MYGPRSPGDDALLFVDPDKAEELAHTHRALRTARTWGDLRAALSAERLGEVEERFSEGGHAAPPADDAPFDPDDVFGFADADWPERPDELMLGWAPEEIQQRFGKREHSMIFQEWLEFPSKRVTDVVEAFEARGFTCRRDERLVLLAMGHEAGDLD